MHDIHQREAREAEDIAIERTKKRVSRARMDELMDIEHQPADTV